MTVNHDVVGSSPTAGVLQPQPLSCGFFCYSQKLLRITKKGCREGDSVDLL